MHEMTRDPTDPIHDTASHRIERLVACDQIEANYHTLSGTSAVNLAKFCRKIFLSSKPN